MTRASPRAALPPSRGGGVRRAEAEIARLHEAKRLALVIADERAKENAELRRGIERLWAALSKRQRLPLKATLPLGAI